MEIEVHSSILDVGTEVWDQLVDPAYPFQDYRFLRALEVSGCLGEAVGWVPIYLVAKEAEEVLGATWLYLKSHSYGEYVFDWSWADAWHRMGIPYYPKLVGAIPFTPVTCPKLLVAECADVTRVTAELLAKAEELVADVSGIHWLFIMRSEIPTYKRAGYLIRDSFQFHWQNQGYTDFDAFLGTLTAKRRRDIRRERRLAAESGLRFEMVTGDALTEAHADLFYVFYRSTIQRKFAEAYLNRDFFRLLFSEMKEVVVLQLAYDDEGCAAGALFLQGEGTLFGRYWGGVRRLPFLHFELCMYRGIDFAIEHGLKRFEAGAQGPHKIARGFNPVITKSAHFISQPQLHAAVGNFLETESAEIQSQLASVSTAYRSTRGDS